MQDAGRWGFMLMLVGGGWLVYQLSPVLTPFALAALLAYLGDPWADRLEKLGAGRTAAVAVVFALLFGVAGITVVLVVPLLEEQVSLLIDELPRYIEWTNNRLAPLLSRQLGGDLHSLPWRRVTDLLQQNWQQAGGAASYFIRSLSQSTSAILAWVGNAMLVPVVTFYLLRDWDQLLATVDQLVPRRALPTVHKLVQESDTVLSAFLRGQFAVMLALGVIYSLGLWLAGLKLALLFGMFAGLLSFIPYLGLLLGAMGASLAAIIQSHDAWSALPVLLVFIVGQTLEGLILTPKLVGDQVGLHPVVVIFAVLAGGQLFGFLGLLLALPLASVLLVLIRHGRELYHASAWYGELPETGAAAAPDLQNAPTMEPSGPAA